jgi:LPPG:FO 2-phospho-L-lactate transferase
MKIVALAGGVGGAKLAHGLALALPPQDLTIIVNVGDDFWHYGLYICPDLDTVCYNLAEINDPALGWGRADESLAMFAELEKLGGQTWFRLGDRDLATHLERTRRLHAGQPLSVIVRDFCQVWGIQPAILPASDDWIPTIVHTDQGQLAFQDYFVARRCEPKVTGFHFQNVEKAAPAPGVLAALQAADAVVICPSNPWVSIDPILAIPGIRPALADKLILAVSPLIGGQALKGPAAKMYAELGIQPTAAAVAAHYQSFLKVFVLDQADAHLADIIAVENFTAPTWMKSKEERLRLAELIINRIRQIRDSAD